MICYEFKGGIGTSSRRLTQHGRTYTLGVLVQANHGLREQLLVAGVPVGRALASGSVRKKEAGSIIIVVATDAPLLPHQLKRIARRGVAWARSNRQHLRQRFGRSLSGILHRQTRMRAGKNENARVEMLSNDAISPHFEATVQATEEAIINCLIAADTMTGIDDHRVVALPHGPLKDVMKKYNRLDIP